MVIMDEADENMNFIKLWHYLSGLGPSNPCSLKNSLTLKFLHE